MRCAPPGRGGRADRVVPRPFTILEILVATAILGAALAATLALLATARARVIRAQRAWARQHLLAQGVELCLLGGPDLEPPEGLLPPGFQLRASLSPVADLPAEAQGAYAGWVLGSYGVQLVGRDGAVAAETRVEKLVPEGAF